MCYYRCLLFCATKENVKKFEFKGKVLNCKVLSVYDGDTITVGAPFANDIYSVNIRINGIDSPEIKSSDKNEKKHAEEARDFLSKLLLNKIVKVHFIKSEKYGRELAEIYYKGKSISELMISKKLAVPYFGGKKNN